MKATKKNIDSLVALTNKKFRSFGGGYYTPGNPLSAALRDERPQFAAGVDIEEVVRFVIQEERKIK